MTMGRSTLSPFHSSSTVSMLSGHHRRKSSSGDSGSGNSHGNFNLNNFSKESSVSNSPFSQPLRELELAWKEADARQGEGYRRGMLPNDAIPTCVDYAGLRMLISASPTTSASVARYNSSLSKMRVAHVVRVCEPTYSANRLPGVAVHDWEFADGTAPSLKIIDKWLELLDALPVGQSVAVHCRAGLGRAPVLVAVALIEKGMHPFEAAGTIRAMRRGAINGAQMNFLENYVVRKERRALAAAENIKSPNGHRSRRRAFGWIKSRNAARSPVGSRSPVAIDQSH